MGTIAHSAASKARWVGVSEEERSRRMSGIAKARWAKADKKYRKKVGKLLAHARHIRNNA